MDYPDRQSAISQLRDHHSSQEYYPEKVYKNVVNCDGEYLGPYIPFIGERYYDTKPRLLIYAMSQNLVKIRSCIKTWKDKPDKGLLRQYYHLEKPNFSVGPYDNGHLKIIAALIFSCYPGSCFKPIDNIDDLIAVTNFVKFSFHNKNNPLRDSNPPQDIYDSIWENYCKYELYILRPDVIMGVGKEVADALNRNMEAEQKREIKILKIPFPGRLNLNSRYIPKGEQLKETEHYNPAADIIEMEALIKGTSGKKGILRSVIKTDWYYFKEMQSRFCKEFAGMIETNVERGV